MGSKFSYIYILSFFLVTSAYAAPKGDRVIVNGDNVNFRDKPCADDSSRVLGKLSRGKYLGLLASKVKSPCEGDWSMVQDEILGKGYVLEKYLNKATPTEVARIDGDKVNVRSMPCVPSDPVGQAKNLDHVLVFERGIQSDCTNEVQIWARVTVGGMMGYVQEKFLKFPGSANEKSQDVPQESDQNEATGTR